MLRKLSWAGVALFVLADAVLITLALRHTRPDPASAAPLTVTITTRVPATGSTAASTAAPASSASDAGGLLLGSTTASPSPTDVGSTVSASTEPIPGTTPVTVPTASATTVPTPVPADQRLVLDMSSDGSVIRAVRGDCPVDGSSTPAEIQISQDGGRRWTSVPSNATAVLRIAAYRGGNLRYVGTDSTCQPVQKDTSDGGATWESTSTAGSWFLGVDATSHTINGPAGATDVGCAPVALAGIDATYAMVACTDGTVRATDDAGNTWRTASHLAGVVAISFVSATHGYVLAATEHCAAQVLETTTGAQDWRPLACLSGGRPRGIAAAGDRVLAQVGATLDASDDGGGTWSTVIQQGDANG